MQKLRWSAVLKSQEWGSGTIQGRQDATARLIRGVGIPRTMLACFRVFRRLSSNEALPSMEMNRCRGL
eukprot:6160858-Pyramimonas_sp.AAC.1